MANVSVRWRPSSGRGEFEFVPSNVLEDKDISLFFEALNVTIPAEVRGERKQGKPRLRKFEKNNRKKLHLPQLVMAVARLPEPAREDIHGPVVFPLENKMFVMDAMEFEIIEDFEDSILLAPLSVSVLHSKFVVDLQDRLRSISRDYAKIHEINEKDAELAAALQNHSVLISQGTNTIELRVAADKIVALQSAKFGRTNAGSIVTLMEFDKKEPSELEADINGVEGRMLTRIHSYKERDRKLAIQAKNYYRNKRGGKLLCEACGLDPIELYGPNGERCIEAHHKTPIEELLPDSITKVDDLAMVCASCHRIIHSAKPCLATDKVVPNATHAEG